LFAHADAGVEAPGDDIGEAIIDDDLDLDVGIGADELGDGRLSRRSLNPSSSLRIASIRGSID